jgi:hypothetical protein
MSDLNRPPRTLYKLLLLRRQPRKLISNLNNIIVSSSVSGCVWSKGVPLHEQLDPSGKVMFYRIGAP